MDVFALLCYALAFLAFVLAALGVASKVNLIAVGLAAWVLFLLVRAFDVAF